MLIMSINLTLVGYGGYRCLERLQHRLECNGLTFTVLHGKRGSFVGTDHGPPLQSRARYTGRNLGRDMPVGNEALKKPGSKKPGDLLGPDPVNNSCGANISTEWHASTEVVPARHQKLCQRFASPQLYDPMGKSVTNDRPYKHALSPCMLHDS